MRPVKYGVHDEIKQTAETFYKAISNKNLGAIDTIWAHTPYAAVAGRSSHLRQGWPEVRKYWEERFRDLGEIRVVAKLQRPVVHAVRDVAWLSGTELRTVTDGEHVRREELRMTAVLQRTDDQWQIVSYHASEAAPRTEATLLAS